MLLCYMRMPADHSYFIRLYEGACMPLFGGPSFCLYHEGSYRHGIVLGFLQFTLLFGKKDVDNNKDKRKVQARTEMRQKNEAHADCGICMHVTLLFVHR